MMQILWNTVWKFLKMLNRELTYCNSTHRYIPQIKLNTCPHTNYKCLFIAEAYIIPKGRNHTPLPWKYLLIDKWINKIWHNHTMDYLTTGGPVHEFVHRRGLASLPQCEPIRPGLWGEGNAGGWVLPSPLIGVGG